MKPEREFAPTHDIDWNPVDGPATGLSEQVLARDPDTGAATRMLRFAPGTDTTANGVQVHDFTEEVYILSGSLHDLSLGRTFGAGMYASRPPGMRHGPWRTDEGCVTFEVRYYARESTP
jgi:ChrR-like protein with cupin domain